MLHKGRSTELVIRGSEFDWAFESNGRSIEFEWKFSYRLNSPDFRTSFRAFESGNHTQLLYGTDDYNFLLRSILFASDSCCGIQRHQARRNLCDFFRMINDRRLNFILRIFARFNERLYNFWRGKFSLSAIYEKHIYGFRLVV